MNTTRLRIAGIYTVQDAADVLRALSALPTVKEAEVSDGLARIHYNDLSPQQILDAVTNAGKYSAEIITTKHGCICPLDRFP